MTVSFFFRCLLGSSFWPTWICARCHGALSLRLSFLLWPGHAFLRLSGRSFAGFLAPPLLFLYTPLRMLESSVSPKRGLIRISLLEFFPFLSMLFCRCGRTYRAKDPLLGLSWEIWWNVWTSWVIFFSPFLFAFFPRRSTVRSSLGTSSQFFPAGLVRHFFMFTASVQIF